LSIPAVYLPAQNEQRESSLFDVRLPQEEAIYLLERVGFHALWNSERKPHTERKSTCAYADSAA